MEQPVAMTIDKELADGKLTLKVCGRLDTNTSPKLEEELKLGEVLEVAFDFTGLEYISSAGLRVLMNVYKGMMASGGRMVVLNPNETVKGVFDMTGLGEMFNLT